jgi:rare lipoprotein A
VVHLNTLFEKKLKMKLEKNIYLTIVFSLGVSTIISTLFTQSSIASTENNSGILPNKASIVTSNRTNLSKILYSQNLSEKNSSLSWSTEQPLQIAQEAYQGKASWYGPQFHGRMTANGEIFDSNQLTAAHPNLPFGTKVKVTNMVNGRSVVVRINDRGPFVQGRIIDVSAGAARLLNMISTGVANVQLEILGR